MVESADIEIAGLNRDIEYLKDRLREMHDDVVKARDSAFMIHRLLEKTVELELAVKGVREDLDATSKLLGNWRYLAIALGMIGTAIGYVVSVYSNLGKAFK